MLAAAGGIAPGDLPPVMDLEVTDNTPDATIQSRMQTWFSAMQSATGMTPLLYFSPSFAPHAGTSFGGHALWVAEWGAKCPSVPAPWSTWDFWQTSDMGSIAGIPATVDLDEFNGTMADLPVLGAGAGADGGTDGGADAGPYADGGGPDGGDGASAPDGGSGGGATMGSGGGPGACR
jgi:lysozyme